MTYNIQVSGQKADALDALSKSFEQQSTNMQGSAEKEQLQIAVDDVRKLVDQYAGESDSVTISLSGHLSQSDTAFGLGKSCGISVSKANNVTATQRAQQTGIPVGGSAPTASSTTGGTSGTAGAAGGPVTGQAALDAARASAAAQPNAANTGATVAGAQSVTAPSAVARPGSGQ